MLINFIVKTWKKIIPWLESPIHTQNQKINLKTKPKMLPPIIVNVPKITD